ncbi:DUF1269 domain-containing protein [Streptacidiphilus fuscans]|uniref:DUF1269 domain-containing protein n=1 Tax=Streptacidiphilus fuscans TaxID=2789292 RepID=A0A931FED1_9ACTN|nr:DUF1269 domain-containing protein [Streptacidiphilus fuscans]MBF9071627.1 DUF1269 domain-containing protein [Streptacidiphilus fuscans]MBF9072886.1 DUF1269 domain-containing protein [Streptacidiphilus fuscans]
MSNLIAVAYPDVATAEQVRNKLIELQKQKLIKVEDAVVVERRPDGKVKLHQAVSTTGAAAAGGALWGGLIGLLFFMPFLGAAIGGATGAAVGSAQDFGVDDNFMRQVGQHLTPGAAAVFTLVSDAVTEKVLPELAPFGGQLIQTSLSPADEEHLKEAVAAAQSAAHA